MATFNRTNNFTDDVSELRNSLQEIKGMQRAGLDINRVYEIETGDDYDFYMPAEPHPAWENIMIEFTADNQIAPFTKPVLSLIGATTGNYINPKSVYIFYTNQTLSLPNRANKALYFCGIQEQQWSAANPPVPLTEDVKIKVYVYASDTGSLRVY